MSCGWCGTTFIPQHPHQKYCSKTCSRNMHREQKNRYARQRYRRIRNKEIIDNKVFKPGTGNLTENRLPDDNKEFERVRREKRRLKL